jgi:hypothetical protein
MAGDWTFVGADNDAFSDRAFYYRSKGEDGQTYQVINVDCLSYMGGPEKDAASFKVHRTETARLGTQVSPEAAPAQGFNQENRANRKAFQEGIDTITKASNDQVAVIDGEAESLHDKSQSFLILLAAGGLLGGIALGGLIGYAQISRPLKVVVGAIDRLASGDYTLPETNTHPENY